MKNPVVSALALPDATELTTKVARGTGVSFLELKDERRNVGVTRSVREEAFLISLQLKRSIDFDLYVDGKAIQPKGFNAQDIAIFDLRANLFTDQRDPFHAIGLYLPTQAIFALGDDGDISRDIQELRHTPGASLQDPVACNLLHSIRPALLEGPRSAPELFVDHVALAMVVHLADKYGVGGPRPRRIESGLAPWQERRAKELIDANIGGSITLNVLAHSCELSTRHFARAFRQSTGMAPYQWLQSRRMQKAKHLLEQSSATLSDIALDCGFADQSHFTRTFSRLTGTTPKTWRRMNHE